MSSPIVSITSSSASKESPITTEYLTEVISEDISKLIETNALIEFLLAKLQKKSSKHKFLIQATRLKSPSPIEADLNILTSFGAVWDSNRDGYISLKVELKGDKDKEAEKKGDLIEEQTRKGLDKEVNDELNIEEKKSEENTLEAGPNDKFKTEDTKDVLSTIDIKPDEDDDIKTGEDDDVRLKEETNATELEGDDKVEESGIAEPEHNEESDIAESEDNAGGDVKEEVRTTEPKDADSLKEEVGGTTEPEDNDQLEKDVVDSKKAQYMGQDDKADGRDEKDLPILKTEVDSSTDTILVSVYWVFVD